MSLWIPVTLGAAVCQILRTSRQHDLRAHLSSSAAGFARYLYGLPFALAAAIVTFALVGRPVPAVGAGFWGPLLVAAVSQIVATIALLQSFRERDFAVGTVFSKTEVLIVAALGAVGVGQALRPWGWLGAVVVAGGVILLSLPDRSAASAGTVTDRPATAAAWRPAVLGLVAGAGFGLAAIGIGAASRSLVGGAPVERALLTLTVLLGVQTVLNGAWFAVRRPEELRRCAAAWRPALSVGVLSMAGSLGWAWAFTLEGAAKVRTLGQVELLLAFAIGVLVHGEHHPRRDYVAGALVLAGVVVVAAVG